MNKGDLLYLPANARIIFRDGVDRWVFWETQTPSSAVFLKNEQGGACPINALPNPVIKMYWDSKFCWTPKEDIFLARKKEVSL
jgi:hypothetical protein